jgi:hypothetical protein
MKPLSVTEIAHKATVVGSRTFRHTRRLLAVPKRPGKNPRPFQLTQQHRAFLRGLDAVTDIFNLPRHKRRTARILAREGFLLFHTGGRLVYPTPAGLAAASEAGRSKVALAKIKNGANAIRWALQEYAPKGSRHDADLVVDFLDAWQDGSVVTAPEWGEYRYWCTGEHE